MFISSNRARAQGTSLLASLTLVSLGALARAQGQEPVPAELPTTPTELENPPDEKPTEPELSQMPGLAGPAEGDLGEYAKVNVPEGFHFLGADDARSFLESMGNPASQRELGLVFHAADSWFVVFEYSDTGHVKDDDKDELDADRLLASMREGNEQGNQVRKERGWATIELLGWAQLPHYDEATQNLEWAMKAKSDNGESVNHNTRILGRTGVMEATLVCGAEDFVRVLPDYRTFIKGFDFKQGQRYTEYVAGDKLAAYGLTALVAGGAGVLAAKTGLFTKLWKFLVIGAIAVAGFVKRIFSRKSDKSVEA